MSFSVTVPNAGQSPGLFPTQNNNNFLRLKDIVNADHNFTDSTATNQGAHKQVTFINRTPPVVGFPSGTNAVLYTAFDADNVSQLNFFNGAANYQLTPTSPFTLLGTGTKAITTGTTSSMFLVPASSFGFLYMWMTDGINYAMETCLWISGTDRVVVSGINNVIPNVSSGVNSRPVYFSNTGIVADLNLRPFTSNSSFNGTYNYRVFKVN